MVRVFGSVVASCTGRDTWVLVLRFWLRFFVEVGGGSEDEKNPDKNDGTKINPKRRLPTETLGVEIPANARLSPAIGASHVAISHTVSL